MLTYKMAIALRPRICDVTSPYVQYVTVAVVISTTVCSEIQTWVPLHRSRSCYHWTYVAKNCKFGPPLHRSWMNLADNSGLIVYFSMANLILKNSNRLLSNINTGICPTGFSVCKHLTNACNYHDKISTLNVSL